MLFIKFVFKTASSRVCGGEREASDAMLWSGIKGGEWLVGCLTGFMLVDGEESSFDLIGKFINETTRQHADDLIAFY